MTRKPKTNRIAVLILAALIILLFAIGYFLTTPKTTWKSPFLYGGIYNKILKTGNMLIAGTSFTQLYALDANNGSTIWKTDLNVGTVNPLQVYKNSVLTISGDTLWLISLRDGSELWHKTTNNLVNFDQAMIYKNTAVAWDTDGQLYTINAGNGKDLWNIQIGNAQKFSTLEIDGWLRFFGKVYPEGNDLLVVGRDGSFYRINLQTGKIIWKVDLQGTPTTSYLNGKQIIIGTKEGHLMAINTTNGSVQWNETGNGFMTCIRKDKSSPFNALTNTLVEVRNDGTVMKRDGNSGRVIWSKTLDAKNIDCPILSQGQIILTSFTGSLWSISIKSGNIRWTKTGFGFIPNSLSTTLTPKGTLLFGNTTGRFYGVSSKNGETQSEYDMQYPVFATPLLDKKAIFVAASSGTIYRLNYKTGLPDQPNNALRIKVAANTQTVGTNDIHELTATISGYTFTNPWSEPLIKAQFTHESGKQITVEGFYYDVNTWKVRFNPPLKGKWEWVLSWTPFGKTITKKGEFMATTNTENSFIRIDPTNPKRLTLDGNTIFNGIGIGDTVLDQNQNGNPLDDWATDESQPYVYKNYMNRNTEFKSDTPITLNQYLQTYGPENGGFNIFRLSLENWALSLKRDFWNPAVFSIHDGKVADILMQSLRNNNIHVWLSLFSWSVPNVRSPEDQALLRSYIHYAVARYGAYVDVWELVNETALPKNTLSFLSDEIRKLDFEKHPITTSFEETKSNKIDIISPHWYETEPLNISDKRVTDLVSQYESFPKPVVFGEQGNLTSNYDATSAIRMRVRSWTAFFSEAILIFWNTSYKKDVVNESGDDWIQINSNIYLGSQERSYVHTLQEFTRNIPLKTRKQMYSRADLGSRIYTLSSEKEDYAYIFHYANPNAIVRVPLKINVRAGTHAYWIDPATGKELRQDSCITDNCQLLSPSFTTDIALRIK